MVQMQAQAVRMGSKIIQVWLCCSFAIFTRAEPLMLRVVLQAFTRILPFVSWWIELHQDTFDHLYNVGQAMRSVLLLDYSKTMHPIVCLQRVIKHFQKDCRLLQVWLLSLCPLLLTSPKFQVPDVIYRLFVLRARPAKMCRCLSW